MRSRIFHAEQYGKDHACNAEHDRNIGHIEYGPDAEIEEIDDEALADAVDEIADGPGKHGRTLRAAF